MSYTNMGQGEAPATRTWAPAGALASAPECKPRVWRWRKSAAGRGRLGGASSALAS